MKGGGGDSLLWAYYLATPLFVVLDFGFAMPIRAVGIESPGLPQLQHGGCAAAIYSDVVRKVMDPRRGSRRPARRLVLDASWGQVPPYVVPLHRA